MSRLLPIAGALCLLLAACLSPSSANGDTKLLHDQLGHIELLGPGEPAIYLLYPDAEPNMRYCLDAAALNADIKHPGTRVRFSGVVGKLDANVRMACQPFELHSISVLPTSD